MVWQKHTVLDIYQYFLFLEQVNIYDQFSIWNNLFEMRLNNHLQLFTISMYGPKS